MYILCIYDIFIVAEMYVIVILVFNSLVKNDVEHLVICLFASCIPSLMRNLFTSFAHF